MVTINVPVELDTWLHKNDIRLFLDRTTLASARKQFNNLYQKNVSANFFRESIVDSCNYWKTAKRKPKLSSTCITERRWTRLRTVVSEISDDLVGLSLSDACELVSASCSCNSSLLSGLPLRFHFWDKERF